MDISDPFSKDSNVKVLGGHLVDDCQLISHAGYDRPTSTRVVFHGPTHGSATGALQPLNCGFGTVCRPGFASPTMTLENSVGS